MDESNGFDDSNERVFEVLRALESVGSVTCIATCITALSASAVLVAVSVGCAVGAVIVVVGREVFG